MPLRGELERDSFAAALEALHRRAGRSDTSCGIDDHWAAFRERKEGRSRWDAVVPPHRGPTGDAEGLLQWKRSLFSVPNILTRRPYTAYSFGGIQYVIDLFNPANELGIPYAGAGETVIALLLHEAEHGNVQKRLAQNDVFHSALRELDGILAPEHICGTHSMFSVLQAYGDGRLDPKNRPWELLYQLTLLHQPVESELSPSGMHRTTNDGLALLWPILTNARFMETPMGRLFKRVDVWDPKRVLVQLSTGITAALGPEYAEAARVLGMKAAQELMG
jgi:hypothetical protein